MKNEDFKAIWDVLDEMTKHNGSCARLSDLSYAGLILAAMGAPIIGYVSYGG